MTNITLFNQYCAQFLALLYQSFPTPQDIYLVDELEDCELDEFAVIVNAQGQECPKAKIAWHTLMYLQNEGYVRIKDAFEHHTLIEVTLTAKGLLVLNKVPDALQVKKTLGEQLTQAMKTGSKQAINALINEVIQGAM